MSQLSLSPQEASQKTLKESQGQWTVEKIITGPEIRILQLDIEENVTVPNEPTVDIVEPSVQSVCESRPEVQDNVTQPDSAQPTAPASTAQPQAGIEFIEISLYEQKPSQTQTQVAKTKVVQEQHPDMDRAPKSLDEKSATMEETHMEPKVCILQLDIQTSPEEQGTTSVTGEKQPQIDVVEGGVQTGRESDEKTTDIMFEKAAAEVTKIIIQESITECQKDSAQPTSLVSESLQPHETKVIEISLPGQDIVRPSQAETKMEVLKTANVKEQVVQEKKPALGVADVPMSLDVRSVQEESEPKVLYLQLDIPSTSENSDKTTTDIHPKKTERVEVQQISTEKSQKVSQSDSAQAASAVIASVQPNKSEKMLAEISLSEQDAVKPETVKKVDVLKDAEDRPKEAKDRSVDEDVKVSKKDVHDAPKSQEEKSVTVKERAEIPVIEPQKLATVQKYEIISIALPKVSKFGKDQTSIQTGRVTKNQELISASTEPEKTENVEEHGHKEFVEISKSEQDTTKPETVKKVDVLNTSQDGSKEAKDDAPQSLDKKSVPVEKIHKGTEVPVSQPDKPAKEQEIPLVPARKKSKIAKDQTGATKPETVSKLDVLKTTGDKTKDAKAHSPEEDAKDVHDGPQSLVEKSVTAEKIIKGAEVPILQSDKPAKEHKISSVVVAKVPEIEKDPTSIQQYPTSASVQPEKTEKIKENVRQAFVEISTSESDAVKPETVNKMDVLKTTEDKPKDTKDHSVDGDTKVSTKDVHDAPQGLDKKSVTVEKIPKETEVPILQSDKPAKKQEISSVAVAKAPKTDKDTTSIQQYPTSASVQQEKTENIISQQRDTPVVPSKTALERPKETKDSGVQEEQVLTVDVQDASKSLDEKSVEKTEVSIGVEEDKTVTAEKKPQVESSVQFETVKESKDLTFTDGQPEKRSTEVDVQRSFKVQTDKKTTDATKEKEEQPKEKIQEDERETISVELPLQVKTATSDVNVPQEQVFGSDRTSPASLQALQKSPTRFIPGEVSHVEGSSPQEQKADAVKPEKVVLEAPDGSAMRNVFTEIQQLAGTGPNSQLIENKPVEDAPEALISPTSDLDVHLSRLVSKVLSCKSCPAELSPAAMARQVEELQECREAAEAQVSSLSQVRSADSDNSDALEYLEDQWSTAAQDAAAVIQNKEAQLQLVTDYCNQIQAAKSLLEKQTAELEAVRMSPDQSSSKEAERLCSLQRNMEENRTLLGELLVTHSKLIPLLSRSERTTAQTELKNLQDKWRTLERTVENSLHRANAHSQISSRVLADLRSLQEHLETLDKDLKAKSPSEWNCQKVQQLMEANAEVKAVQQQVLHLEQLSEALVPSSKWETEAKEMQQELQKVKVKLSSTEELVSSQTLNSSSPIMEKIVVVMRDGFAWAKQTESDIEGRRKRVALLPEEVHRQLRDLKKLQSEVMAKQGQLEVLVEELTELLPQLDQAEEVPMLQTSLECLVELSHSTTEKLSKAEKEMESGLQTREKLSEQIADLDSWIVAHLQREASRSADSELRSPAEFDRRVRQIQETLNEAEKQAAVCEALLMKSKDIASELSVAENCKLFDKLTNLQEDITAISSYEKANKKELDDLLQNVDSSKKNLVAVEKSLRQMLVDLSRYRFPITKESLQALEPFKHLILEHKSQVDHLQPWIPQEKTRELNSVISELHSKMVLLQTKAKDHETYLNLRQCVEDLRENVQEQVLQTKDDSRDVEEKYKTCETLLVQFPLMKMLCDEAGSKLEAISSDLYPSQLTMELQRLKQNEESLDTWEMALRNNLSIIEWNLLKDLDLDSEKKAVQTFFRRSQQELKSFPVMEPNEAAINKEYRIILSVKKAVESRMRAVETLEKKKGKKQSSRHLMDFKNVVLGECDSQMESILQARESLRSYTSTVREAVEFLRELEVQLLPPHGSAGFCSQSLQGTQQALASLQQHFQTHVEKLQNQAALHPYLSPQKVEQLQENILSQLLVRMSTLQAKGHVRLERLSRCAEQHRNYIKSQDELILNVKTAENRLLQFISQKVTCVADCTDQETKFTALCEEMESLLRQLEELKEFCPEQSCRGGREAVISALWRRLSRLRRCTKELKIRSKQRITECQDITNSVEKASTVLEQVEAELPEASRVKPSTEELQDLLQTWEQYQDRLDCEHRALSALELRAARLLGVPSHLEQAPPILLCQQLQKMQGRYGRVKQKSMEGLLATRMELEEREKIREELQGIRVWTEAAEGLLMEMEKSSSTQQLQDLYSQLCTQKSLLQRIMESLKMKYSDMYTLVPVEVDSQLKEVTNSLKEVEVKVGEAVARSGPVHKLGAKLSEIQAGLRSVQNRLEQRSPTVIEAKVTQKRVWDELDVWHSRLAALEVELQDLEKPEEALILTERLVEVQQLHSLLAKQAEQRTTLLSKIHTWLQEHQEMINSSKSWMSEAQSWLAAPCTYTTAKCLSSHVHALQMVLDDSAQIRTTLQNFSSVLKEMSQVCDVTTLQEQLVEADRQVADVQDSFTTPLSQLEHAAAEVEAIESEVRKMESDVAEIKTLLSSPESLPSPREDSLKMVEQRIQSMRRTVAEIQKCKPGLCLPEKAEETLTVFSVVNQLQTLLLELEKKVPALFIAQPPTPIQAKAQSTKQTTSQPQLQKSTSGEAEKEEQGQIRIVHVEEDVLRRSGATLLTVERTSPEQRQSWTPENTQEPAVVASEEAEAAAGQKTELSAAENKDVEVSTDTTEASSSEALSKPLGTVRTQSLPESMVNTASTVKASKADSGSQQKCVVS